MSTNVVVVKNCVIPANTAANSAQIIEFEHSSNNMAQEVYALGIAEISNPNQKHYNFGFNAFKDVKTIDSVSKNFYLTNASNPLSERFTPIEFTKPSDKKSQVILTPTEASGNADIVVQVVLKYK